MLVSTQASSAPSSRIAADQYAEQGQYNRPQQSVDRVGGGGASHVNGKSALGGFPEHGHQQRGESDVAKTDARFGDVRRRSET